MSIFKLKLLLVLIKIVQVICVEDLIILEAEKNIDIATQLTKIKTNLKLFNNGTKKIEEFQWLITEKGILSYIKVLDSDKNELKFVKNLLYIKFDKPLEPSSSKVLKIKEVYAKGIVPYPSEVKLNEEQFVIYKGNLYLLTDYFVKEQRTTVSLPNNFLESYTDLNASKIHNGIIYGPYKNIQPLTEKKLSVHFKNNGLFLIIPELKRKLRISPWGTIFVEEKV